uniref:Uncharacterized protein n=1 Tax=Heterorhabditis bacteriophora TaxID=37862 RepID=A0A1I7WFK3_HETBA
MNTKGRHFEHQLNKIIVWYLMYFKINFYFKSCFYHEIMQLYISIRTFGAPSEFNMAISLQNYFLETYINENYKV